MPRKAEWQKRRGKNTITSPAEIVNELNDQFRRMWL